MELSERKKKVLRSVVDLYIRTAEPVGSKAITELPDMKYSSATIRNEMADLTALGLLEQPHTSAGRIPSAAGYRMYVDELMMDYRLSIDETKSINMAIEEKMARVDKMVEKVAKLVSQATDLPAISVAARQKAACVEHFELVHSGKGSIILMLVLPGDQVVNKGIKLPVSLNETDLKLLSAVLNAAMAEVPLEGLNAELMEKVMRSAGNAAPLVPVILDFTQETLKNQGVANMAVFGQSRLLGLPEYRDVDKAQRVMSSIDADALANLPAVMGDITGTRLAAAPAEAMTLSRRDSVISSRAMSVMVALSTALRSFRSVSVMFRGSLISLLTTCSPRSISTRMKLPLPAWSNSKRSTTELP